MGTFVKLLVRPEQRYFDLFQSLSSISVPSSRQTEVGHQFQQRYAEKPGPFLLSLLLNSPLVRGERCSRCQSCDDVSRLAWLWLVLKTGAFLLVIFSQRFPSLYVLLSGDCPAFCFAVVQQAAGCHLPGDSRRSVRMSIFFSFLCCPTDTCATFKLCQWRTAIKNAEWLWPRYQSLRVSASNPSAL